MKFKTESSKYGTTLLRANLMNYIRSIGRSNERLKTYLASGEVYNTQGSLVLKKIKPDQDMFHEDLTTSD